MSRRKSDTFEGRLFMFSLIGLCAINICMSIYCAVSARNFNAAVVDVFDLIDKHKRIIRRLERYAPKDWQ